VQEIRALFSRMLEQAHKRMRKKQEAQKDDNIVELPL
jgi:hypothetical protein